MKAKILLNLLAILCLISVVAISCTKQASTSTQTMTPTTTSKPAVTSTTTATSKPVVTSTTTATSAPTTTTAAKWWDKFGTPQYGGTITRQVNSINPNFDPWYGGPFGGPLQQYESACWEDWTLDRSIWSFSGAYVPDDYYIGALAKSWEMTDTQTLVVHIRQGVKWQNMTPVNGREFTADDFAYQYNRMFGIGGGFTKPSPYWLTQSGYIASVTATDKYTAVVKFKKSSALNLHVILQPGQFNYIAPREAVELSKDSLISDWKIAAGTGAWMVTDFVTDNAVTFSKNPNYWGYDERYPKNQLPYADTLKIIKIADTATAMAALRTAKIELMMDLKWDQATTLMKSNPDLQQVQVPAGGATVDFRTDKSPYTNINVRKALQMALDRESIAKTYYGGTVDGKPSGLVSPAYKGWCTPYDEWPKDLHDEYSFNIIKARDLLTAAGYPNGFKTNILAPANSDLNLLQVIKAQLLDIGVDMEIKVMDPGSFSGFAIAGKQDQLTYSAKTGVTFEPWVALDYRSRIPTNFSMNKDPVYDAMIVNLETLTTMADVKQKIIEADTYALSKHWGMQVCPIATYTIWQPYLKGYSGEAFSTMRSYPYYARLWIDQSLKK